MTKTIRISRTWKVKDYESFRVSAEDDVPEGVVAVVVARRLALDCHEAYDDYLLHVLPGFTGASHVPRRDGAEQGRETADSPSPTSAGAGEGAGAEDPGAPPANGPGSVTEAQLAELHALMAKSSWGSEIVRKALVNLKSEKVEQISTDAAAGLIGKLKRGESETKGD